MKKEIGRIHTFKCMQVCVITCVAPFLIFFSLEPLTVSFLCSKNLVFPYKILFHPKKNDPLLCSLALTYIGHHSRFTSLIHLCDQSNYHDDNSIKFDECIIIFFHYLIPFKTYIFITIKSNLY